MHASGLKPYGPSSSANMVAMAAERNAGRGTCKRHAKQNLGFMSTLAAKKYRQASQCLTNMGAGRAWHL